jgi:hypothetical protein
MATSESLVITWWKLWWQKVVYILICCPALYHKNWSSVCEKRQGQCKTGVPVFSINWVIFIDIWYNKSRGHFQPQSCEFHVCWLLTLLLVSEYDSLCDYTVSFYSKSHFCRISFTSSVFSCETQNLFCLPLELVLGSATMVYRPLEFHFIFINKGFDIITKTTVSLRYCYNSWCTPQACKLLTKLSCVWPSAYDDKELKYVQVTVDHEWMNVWGVGLLGPCTAT